MKDTREALFEAAEHAIRCKGFSAVGIAEILAAAGVPKGSFYHHFQSKEQFGAELLQRYFDGYLSRLDSALATEPDPLLSYFERWANLQGSCLHDDQCLVTKLAAEVCDLSPAMRQIFEAGTSGIVARIAGAAEQSGYSEPQTLALTLYELWLGASLLTKIRCDDSAMRHALTTTTSLLKNQHA